MLIITLYTKMSEYIQKTIVINRPTSLSFHIFHSHFIRSPCSAIVTRVAVSRAPIIRQSTLFHSMAPSKGTRHEAARCPSLAHTDEIQRSFTCRLLGGSPDMAGSGAAVVPPDIPRRKPA